MKKILRNLLALLVPFSFGLALVSCEGDAERAGRKVDRAVEDVEDEVEDAGDEIEDKTDPE